MAITLDQRDGRTPPDSAGGNRRGVIDPLARIHRGFAAACVMVGVYWDISWHMSIGRDSFWTPAPADSDRGPDRRFSSGYVALKTTLRGTDVERNAAVSFWGFRAPLGVDLYLGLRRDLRDVGAVRQLVAQRLRARREDRQPAHVILALGIYAIVVGALLLTLAERIALRATRRRLAIALP
jgi:hypothetical protein